MRKRIILTLFLMAALSITAATAAKEKKDTTYWSKTTILGLNFNQVSMSNWAAGGDNSVGMDGLFKWQGDYKKERVLWQNKLDLAYGINYTKGNVTKKTHDNIFLSSNLGYELRKNLYASFLVTFQTQFAKGYDYSGGGKKMLSKFMAPGYLTVGPGLTWTPRTWLTTTFSPFTWRATFVTDKTLSDAGAFGVDPGDRVKHGFGANLMVDINKEIFKNVTLITRLSIFSDYLDKPLNMVINWDLLLNMKINSWLAANFTLNTIYDDRVKFAKSDGRMSPQFQIKESLGVGLQFTF